MHLCLNAIVKNEMANLPRMLNSVKDHIKSYAIYDTGSTDGTQEYIENFFEKEDIPGVVFNGYFEDFGQARNAGLRITIANLTEEWDYLLLMDADMELVVDGPLGDLGAPAYTMVQQNNALRYHNTRLLKRGVNAKYVGVTHEFLSVPGIQGEINNWWFKDHATGSNRVDKVKRDIRLLKADLKKDPNNERTHFYLAQSHRESGETGKAISHYRKRIALGGWDEEVWYSKLAIARCNRDINDNYAFVLSSLDAYNFRPSRAEPLADLATFYRMKGDNALGWLYADCGSRIPYPGDLLFVESDVYKYRLLQEKAITGFYQPNTWREGFDACNKVALMRDIPEGERELARTNLGYYLRPLSDYAKSWDSKAVAFHSPDPMYTNANPSIVVHHRKFIALVRTVNYKIRSDGSYDMQGDTSIRTENWLVPLDYDLKPEGRPVLLIRPFDLPAPKYDPVLGFEDMRLISCNGKLMASATMREQSEWGDCEQWAVYIDPNTGILSTAYKMPTPCYINGRVNEKNWMPIADNGVLAFMYRPAEVIWPDGQLVRKWGNTQAVDHFSGGSQLISWEGGWVGLIHEARMDPAYGYSKRYYQHRFVFYGKDFDLQKVSKPFCFERKQIEFCAGLAKHPRKQQFVITYSVNDSSANIATISDADLKEFIWHV